MKMGDDDDNRRAKSAALTRVVDEFDFFDEKRSGAKHIYLLPPLIAPIKQIIFPQILNSPSQQTHDRRPSSPDDEAMNSGSEDHDDTDSHSRIDTSSRETKWKNAPIPPRFLLRIVEEIQDHQLVFLFDKKLEFADVGRKQNRLLISGSERVMAALTEEERGSVEREGFLEVTTTDPREKEYTMRLKNMGAIGVAVIGHEWFKLVSANQLEEGDSVLGWGYRTPKHFRFAINYVRNF